jgi:hypothetical protein
MKRIGIAALTDAEKQARYSKAHPRRVKAALSRFQKACPEFWAVDAAKQRCTNPKNPMYKHYGARGIECRITYKELLATIGRRPSSPTGRRRSLYSLDRIDNDGHYEAGNVRWATYDQQMANRRD